jgi:hypothetical protein
MEDLKSIRVALQDFFDSHKEVAEYTYGDIKDFTARTDRKLVAVNIEYQNSVPNTRFNQHIYNVTIADRMNLEIPMTEHDAVARCYQIAADLAGFIGLTNTYTFSSVQPFREETGDILAGVVASFAINTPLQINECVIPLT